MEEYLAFVDEIGRGLNGTYIYRLDFTTDTESVWGDFFNSIPALIVPDLQPDVNSISGFIEVEVDRRLCLAKNNGCFSMQDCIDGIISLAFFELDDCEVVFHLDFGDEYSVVRKKLLDIGVSTGEVVHIEHEDTGIDELMDTLKNNEDRMPIVTFSIGSEYNRDDVRETLFRNGYVSADLVVKCGEYAFRGYMIDIYGFNEQYPVRIEFFGNEVEDIFFFDFNSGEEIEHRNNVEIFGGKK